MRLVLFVVWLIWRNVPTPLVSRVNRARNCRRLTPVARGVRIPSPFAGLIIMSFYGASVVAFRGIAIFVHLFFTTGRSSSQASRSNLLKENLRSTAVTWADTVAVDVSRLH